MSLRGLPPSERTFATLVVLALAAALGMGLVSTYIRELRPAPPAQAPPARSRLVAVLEGGMAANTTPAETERFRAWVASGATREGFAQVESVVANNCASCHEPGGQYPRLASFEDLRPLALEAAPEGLLGLVDARTLHLIGFPLLFLVAVAGYLRRTAGSGRRLLMGGCALAVGFDAAQWWLRQGRPEALWAAWVGVGALAATMAVLAAMVLSELWKPKSR
ncbi:MAG: hypothetical protein Q8K67_06680 [Geothrix sp.]|nr:hypothetical protein [Geothrix sp.]